MKTIRFILLSLVIGCFQSLNAQSSVAKELYKQGEESYENGNYLDAASKFTRALAESPD